MPPHTLSRAIYLINTSHWLITVRISGTGSQKEKKKGKIYYVFFSVSTATGGGKQTLEHFFPSGSLLINPCKCHHFEWGWLWRQTKQETAISTTTVKHGTGPSNLKQWLFLHTSVGWGGGRRSGKSREGTRPWNYSPTLLLV